MIRKVFLVLLFLLAPMQARADDVPYALYAAGKYDEAMKAGAKADTAWGFVVAARAALADAQTRAKPCLACLEQSIKFSNRALRIDDKMPDAHTFRAVALGYKARIVGVIQSRLQNYPKRARRDLDMALAADPKNVWALAALGGWHIEIVRIGGSYLADFFYNATTEKGLESFEAAFKSAPDNLPVRFQYALSISGYDSARFSDEITKTLAMIAKMTPKTAYERVAQARAAELAAAWKKDDRTEFGVLVRRYQGYP